MLVVHAIVQSNAMEVLKVGTLRAIEKMQNRQIEISYD